MSGLFFIKRFQPEDKKFWVKLWHDYTENYEPTAVAPAVLQSNWQTILANDGRLYAYSLHAESGDIVGFIHYVFFHSTKSIHSDCYLIDLYVDPAYQGKGGGSLMLKELIKECRQKKLFRVWWIAKEANDKAKILYDKMAESSEWVRYKVITDQA